jgi:hypothetical protein
VFFLLAGAMLLQTPASADPIDSIVDSYNYVIGTQDAGDGLYGFTGESRVLESARRIREMGANVIKLPWGSTGKAVVPAADFDTILHMPFYFYFIWYRTPYGTNNPGSYFTSPALNYWVRGITAAEVQMEYDSTYNFARRLLTECNGTGKKFYLGHWEGDWLMLDDYNNVKDASATSIQAMTDWLNARQKAVDDAKKNIAHSNVDVFCYTEVNKVLDAMNNGRKRLVNAVLPNVNIDYVSFSSYDVQWNDQNTINSATNYLAAYIKPKTGITGKRVFFLEFSINAMADGFSMAVHEQKNRDIILKSLRWGTPYLLYWEMYNNELENASLQRGYWLIDQYNVKWSLYYTMKFLYRDAKKYVRQFYTTNSRVPTTDEYIQWAIAWLTNVKSVTVEPGLLYRLTSKQSAKALTVKDSSLAEGAAIEQRTYAKKPNQMWRIEEAPAGSGYFRLAARHCGKCLTIAVTANGSAATQAAWTNTDNQKWSIDYYFNGAGHFRLINKASGRVLEVNGTSTAEGTNIQQWDWLTQNNQQWCMEEVTDTPGTPPVKIAAPDPRPGAAVLPSARRFKCCIRDGNFIASLPDDARLVRSVLLIDAAGRQVAELSPSLQQSGGTVSVPVAQLKLAKGVYIAVLHGRIKNKSRQPFVNY